FSCIHTEEYQYRHHHDSTLVMAPQSPGGKLTPKELARGQVPHQGSAAVQLWLPEEGIPKSSAIDVNAASATTSVQQQQQAVITAGGYSPTNGAARTAAGRQFPSAIRWSIGNIKYRSRRIVRESLKSNELRLSILSEKKYRLVRRFLPWRLRFLIGSETSGSAKGWREVQYTRLERDTMWEAFGQPTHWLTLEFADDAALEKGFQVDFAARARRYPYWYFLLTACLIIIYCWLQYELLHPRYPSVTFVRLMMTEPASIIFFAAIVKLAIEVIFLADSLWFVENYFPMQLLLSVLAGTAVLLWMYISPLILRYYTRPLQEALAYAVLMAFSIVLFKLRCFAPSFFALQDPSKIEDGNLVDQLGHPLRIRVGMHSGHCVAGVIGRKKFIYDVWGDCVNTASRMESHGTEMRVHCSEDTAREIADSFDLTCRGQMQVKGKGLMTTYYINKERKASMLRDYRGPFVGGANPGSSAASVMDSESQDETSDDSSGEEEEDVPWVVNTVSERSDACGASVNEDEIGIVGARSSGKSPSFKMERKLKEAARAPPPKRLSEAQKKIKKNGFRCGAAVTTAQGKQLKRDPTAGAVTDVKFWRDTTNAGPTGCWVEVTGFVREIAVQVSEICRLVDRFISDGKITLMHRNGDTIMLRDASPDELVHFTRWLRESKSASTNQTMKRKLEDDELAKKGAKRRASADQGRAIEDDE
ncbi:Nitrogen permease regulator 2, partial [Perkinsus chesapeaki]